jgi:hypothetical protein
MKTLRLPKSQVLKAIREESLLAPGSWVKRLPGSPWSDEVRVEDTKFCQVCAVGAVLRRVLDGELNYLVIDYTARQNVGKGYGKGHYTTVEKLYEAGAARLGLEGEGPWTALSHVFETLTTIHYDVTANTVDIARVREDLCTFVERFFPEDVTLKVLEGRKVTDYAKVVTE